METWQEIYRQEMDRAKNARTVGNEGKARVCARRAAGVIVGEYLQQAGLPFSSPSAYDRLRYLISLPGLSDRVYLASQNLLQRVNSEHQLPIEVDLIEEAELLRQVLLRF